MSGQGKRFNYVADFETTTDPHDCRVWSWGIVRVSKTADYDDVIMGHDLDTFIDFVQGLTGSVYFHNLGFDAGFIFDWLFSNGFEYTDEQSTEPGQFTTLIDMMGKHYTIRVHWRNGNSITFKDSLKKLPMSVDKVAKAFSLPMSKLHIDYDEYRAPDHVMDKTEREYLANDVVIIARALALQFDQGATRLTVGSDSLNDFKKLFGTKRFERIFPILPKTMDDDVRSAYRGGWTYADPRFTKRIVGPGTVYDVNSLYPSVMLNHPMPWGFPVWESGKPETSSEYPLFVASITFTARIKPDHVPCIQLKGHSVFGSTDYVSEIPEPVTLTLTNVDLDLWHEQYEMNIVAYNGAWKFKQVHGLFDQYINKWNTIKSESTDEGLRSIAKLHLNSLYGKFATNPNVTGKYPAVDEDGIVRFIVGKEATRNPVYTPIGVFITAYARATTVRAAQANYPVFAYADTDSIHLLTTDEPLAVTVDPKLIGAWKREHSFDYGLFWRAKAYCEREPSGKYHTHVAGLPYAVARNVRLGDFESGTVFDGKLLPKRVKGGIVLVDGSFTLN